MGSLILYKRGFKTLGKGIFKKVIVEFFSMNIRFRLLFVFKGFFKVLF